MKHISQMLCVLNAFNEWCVIWDQNLRPIMGEQVQTACDRQILNNGIQECCPTCRYCRSIFNLPVENEDLT